MELLSRERIVRFAMEGKTRGNVDFEGAETFPDIPTAASTGGRVDTFPPDLRTQQENLKSEHKQFDTKPTPRSRQTKAEGHRQPKSLDTSEAI